VALAAHGRSGLRDIAGQGDVPQEQDIPAMLLFDLAASAKVSEHLRATFSATNLLGAASIESWRPYGARPNAPQQFMLGLKGKL